MVNLAYLIALFPMTFKNTHLVQDFKCDFLKFQCDLGCLYFSVSVL